MPLVKLETSATLAEPQKKRLLDDLTAMVVEVTGKPKQYVMVTVQAAAIAMAGHSGPGAFVDVRGIGGLIPQVNRELSKRICETLKSVLGIPADRVYLTFTDVPATNWGWNGATFG
ncbi:MAG: phenylpyruvate tautomerase MIF-related protein [Kiritimatiellia bacterium]